MITLFKSICHGWDDQPGGPTSLLNPDGVLYFADVAAGPGGFTEYCSWRCWRLYQEWQTVTPNEPPPNAVKFSRSWGFTLAGNDDFKPQRFNQDAPNNTFDQCYGPRQDGNLYTEENQRSFEKVINDGTNGLGVALMMGDGGASVAGEENLQETKMKQLVLCQFIAALLNVLQGGIFVCKLFDCFTPFTVGCLFVLFKTFREFAIIKPVTSRPANSERYVVVRHKLQRRPDVVEYLFQVNSHLNGNRDIVELIRHEHMDPRFVEYMRRSSIAIGHGQVKGLQDLIMYMEDANLPPLDQEGTRRRCLKLWDIPLELKKKFGYIEERRVCWPEVKEEETQAEEKQTQRHGKGKKKVSRRGPEVDEAPKDAFVLNAAAFAAAQKHKAKKPTTKAAAGRANAQYSDL